MDSDNKLFLLDAYALIYLSLIHICMNPARHEYWSARLPISVTSLLTPKKMHYCWKTI